MITMTAERIYDTLTRNDLKQLKKLALREHEGFFERNHHLKFAFYDSLIGVCLCQGAASHYLNPEVGIKDFDIWHFYMENECTAFPYRAHKRIEKGYKDRPIDFLKRAIPKYICEVYPNEPERIIVTYLLERNTYTKKRLLDKAIISLFPNKIFDKVIWKGGYDIVAVA
jgi:hypothetical protein